MSALLINAPAKTNLWLRITGERPDGYHDIATRMLPISLADEITLETLDGDQVEFTCSDPDLPAGEDNLALRAVRALENHCGRRFGARIHVEKKIPSGAGLGGGSSDAATILLGLNHLFHLGLTPEHLAVVGSRIGSDVPFFLFQTVCDCAGRGEIVTPVDFPWDLPVFLMKPAFSVSTAWAYRNLEKFAAISGIPYVPQLCPWGPMENDLERPVFGKHLLLARMKEWLLDQREVHAAILSGSGSCLLAILTRNDRGEALQERVLANFGDTTWTWIGHTNASGQNETGALPSCGGRDARKGTGDTATELWR